MQNDNIAIDKILCFSCFEKVTKHIRHIYEFVLITFQKFSKKKKLIMSQNSGEKKGECGCGEKCNCKGSGECKCGKECECHGNKHAHEECGHECNCGKNECGCHHGHCHRGDGQKFEEEEEYDCDCGCCHGPPPTLLAPRLKVEGASKPQVFTEGEVSETEEEASLGDHIKITLPENSFIYDANFLVIGPMTKVRVTLKNDGKEVYTKDFEIEKCGDVIIEFVGNVQEMLIDNLQDEKANPLKIGGFIMTGATTDMCSLFQTGEMPYLQPLYECQTCKFQPGQCVCKACAEHCHKGHEMKLMLTTGYCDCPAICKCKLTIPEEVDCTVAKLGSKPVPQKLFICKTCHYGPMQRCCEACAKYCHSGHLVVPAPEPAGVCACGSHNAPGAECKFLPPCDVQCSYEINGDKPVLQEMFKCQTCKTTDDQLICESCALICHAKHKLIPVGQKEGVCACGKQTIKGNTCQLIENDEDEGPRPLGHCPFCIN